MNFFTRFSQIISPIISFLMPFLESSAGKILVRALPIGLDIVRKISSDGEPWGAEKRRSVAVDQLKDQLVSSGVAVAEELSVSLLNFIIEAAVSRLKSHA